jgi:hypothetical protein
LFIVSQAVIAVAANRGRLGYAIPNYNYTHEKYILTKTEKQEETLFYGYTSEVL